MLNGFEIRLATVADAEIIAWHRVRMFHEMGLVPEHVFESYRTQCEARLREMLETSEYIGWLASPNERPDQIVAGVGVQLRSVLPHPVEGPGGEISIAAGRHAIIINVFTEPEMAPPRNRKAPDGTNYRVGSNRAPRPPRPSCLRRRPPAL